MSHQPTPDVPLDASVTVESVLDGLGLEVKVSKKSRDDPAFHRSRNKRYRDDEIAVNPSRRPIEIWMKRDLRFTVKSTSRVLRREGKSTGTSSHVDLNLLDPAQPISPDEPSAELVKAAGEDVPQLKRCAASINVPIKHLRSAQIRKLEIDVEIGVDHCPQNLDGRREEVVLGMEVHADHAPASARSTGVSVLCVIGMGVAAIASVSSPSSPSTNKDPELSWANLLDGEIGTLGYQRFPNVFAGSLLVRDTSIIVYATPNDRTFGRAIGAIDRRGVSWHFDVVKKSISQLEAIMDPIERSFSLLERGRNRYGPVWTRSE